jgi:hypothetical protein
VFHLEHGLDPLIPYLDMLAGDAEGPRAMGHTLPGETRAAAPKPQVRPTPDEVALCVEIYAADFARFGYVPDRTAPLAPPPELDPEAVAGAARARAFAARPWHQFARRLHRRVGRMIG